MYLSVKISVVKYLMRKDTLTILLMNDCLVFGNIVSQRENINEFLANNSVPLFLGSPSIGSVYTFEEFISTT